MGRPSSGLLQAVIAGFGLASLAAVAGGGIAHVVLAGAGGVAGAFLLRRRRAATQRQRQQQALAAALPDLIDLLASTVDGGVATDVALGRVARFVDDPLRSLLVGAVGHGGDVGIGVRLSALDPLLRPLGSLLRQSEELGVPIASALRLLAADARDRARSAARERAAAAAPKMLLVVGALLAPASLLVVIGGQLLVLRDVAGGVLV